jgi:hypothetical protein
MTTCSSGESGHAQGATRMVREGAVVTSTDPAGNRCSPILTEMSEILARAYLRLRAGRLPAGAQNSPEPRGNRPQKALDVLAQRSDECEALNSRRTP